LSAGRRVSLALSERVLALSPAAAEVLFREDYSPREDRSVGYQAASGIATIPVRGALANRARDAWWADGSFDDKPDLLHSNLQQL